MEHLALSARVCEGFNFKLSDRGGVCVSADNTVIIRQSLRDNLQGWLMKEK